MQDIVDGWKNWLESILGSGNTDISKLAEQRLSICKECSSRASFLCGICKCPLATKTRSLNTSCPLNKW